MAWTRTQMRHAVDAVLGESVGSLTRTYTTTTMGTASTLVDLGRQEPDGYWENFWLYICTGWEFGVATGEEGLVTDYKALTHTFTVQPAFSSTTTAGLQYELRHPYSAAAIHMALNVALESVGYDFRIEAYDESIVVLSDTRDYTLPASIKELHRIELMSHSVLYRGTATSSSDDTISDESAGWAADAFKGMEVAIYAGTGAGQYRTIESNTDDTLTVSQEWDTNPDETSQFAIKDTTEPPVYEEVRNATIVSRHLHLRDLLSEGARLRLHYTPTVVPLDADTDTTDVPRYYLARRAALHLLQSKPELLPSSTNVLAVADRLKRELDEFRRSRVAAPLPETIWEVDTPRKWVWR